ncbi:branched-chain amino acid ABC transporter ATP-binding protein/permease [Comamonas flocculans]|uniref:Branched-chain amino acid ABC transporter ATP-binding protein/permease n=1 Tax=Comamonas flocculans TaxID=2597701 RepID=A0A5B8RZ42_9BURK|nr:branched-chain amino acid ABC transporter ATP-binding protein/permease [Comamonas flocculans]QEA13455.1 branched-chain amino acid ABC transporter ATP-binding protein/permease [Comamonas flocculans]
MSSRHWTWLAIALLAVAWPLLSPFSITLLNYIGLYALVAVGLVLLTGVGGITSFGQAAFVGLGAYATAWVCTSPLAAQALSGLPAGLLPWLGLLLGLLVTGLIAWILGAVTLPLSGHFLALGTLAWGLSLYYLFGNIEGLGGFTGIAGVRPLSIAGLELASPRLMGIVIWAVLLLAIWAMHNLLDSREGRAIRALKSGRVMAESMGVDTSRQRMKLFLLAALLAAISGWLYTHLQRFVNPTPFNLEIGIEYLFMAVVGGSGHLWGAVLGATLITLLKEQLQDWLPKLLGTSGNFEAIVFGLLMILLLQRAADGLWPLIAARAGRWIKPAPARTARTTQAALGRRKLPPPGQVVLRAEQVTKRFAGLVANDAVDLEVKAGEVHALIGPNGAGKSTFFNMISGVDDPSAGQVALLGQPMTGKPARAFAALGMGRTFQHVRLLGQRTVLENVALGAHLRGRRGWLSAMLQTDRHEEAALLAEARKQIERCGLQSYIDTPAASLPLGQQRIVEIARALAGQPSILLLDEPAAGLRHLEKQALVQLLVQLRAEGLAVLVVEHDMEFVMNLADRVTVLEFGRVIALGTPDEVQANPRVMQAYLGVEDIEGDAA